MILVEKLAYLIEKLSIRIKFGKIPNKHIDINICLTKAFAIYKISLSCIMINIFPGTVIKIDRMFSL